MNPYVGFIGPSSLDFAIIHGIWYRQGGIWYRRGGIWYRRGLHSHRDFPEGTSITRMLPSRYNSVRERGREEKDRNDMHDLAAPQKDDLCFSP